MIRRAPIAGQPGSPRATHLFERRLEQLEARLAARLGPVRLVLHSRAGDCEPWLAAFFALERGAAIASPAPEALRSAIREGHRRGAARLVSLSAGETIIAMSGWLVAERRGYGLACAHDTRLAAYAPHRLLVRRVAALAALEGLSRFDVGAGCHPGTDALWPERREFADFAMAIGGPARRALFDRAMRARRD
jgi:CelD/BcsL family acetyltransferase involved in cellulose biosynthesis